MNLFLLFVLLFYHPLGINYNYFKIKDINRNISYAYDGLDYISGMRYKGRTNESNALVEVDFTASCNTCATRYSLGIAIKDEDANILYTLQKANTFTGTATFTFAIEDELLKNYSYLNIMAIGLFINNPAGQTQFNANLELSNIGSSEMEVSESQITFRKNCPIYYEKLTDGSLAKSYETYGFINTINGNFNSNEIDISLLSFQYSDTLLNEIPFYYEDAYLLIDDVFEGSDIETKNNSYYFPLKITTLNRVCSFSFLQNYYFDYDEDNLFAYYKESRIATNKLKLPSSFDTSQNINYQIVIEGGGAYGDKIIINGSLSVSYKLFGACSNSKYCIKNGENVNGDIEYEQTVEISS